jgi:hypothetical protein
MFPMLRYSILVVVLSPFRRSQQKTLALVVAAAPSSPRPGLAISHGYRL